MFTSDALALARQRGLDLVEVAPNAVPPVCKIMDYGKFKYEQTKKDRDSRKSQKSVMLKEVRLSPTIDEHDIVTKTKMARRFLEEGNKVKLTVRFKGRELAHTNLGRDLLQQVQLMLGENILVEAPSKMEGKSMTMIVSPRPHKGSPPPKQARPQATGDSPPETTQVPEQVPEPVAAAAKAQAT